MIASICPECQENVSCKAMFCPNCGYQLLKKLPNGFGSIEYLGENRRKPYRASVTLGWNIDTTTHKKKQIRKTIGCFFTREEAYEQLVKYNKTGEGSLTGKFQLTINELIMFIEDNEADIDNISYRTKYPNEKHIPFINKKIVEQIGDVSSEIIGRLEQLSELVSERDFANVSFYKFIKQEIGSQAMKKLQENYIARGGKHDDCKTY